MKLRNTTDFDTVMLRSWLRRVVREVEGALTNAHPLGWSPTIVSSRAENILKHCDVWIRQRRPDSAQAKARREQSAAAWTATAAKRRAAGDERGALEAEGHAAAWSEVSRHVTGRAAYSGMRLRITIGDASLESFLWIARHEVWHLFGVRHEHFPDAVMHASRGAYAAVRDVYDIAEDATLPLASPPEPKPVPSAEDRASAKLLRLTEREKAWTTKLKRAETALAKIRKSKRYYEKQIAVAAGKTPKQPPVKRGG